MRILKQFHHPRSLICSLLTKCRFRRKTPTSISNLLEYTREQLIQLRIIHVTILFALALFIYQWSEWSDALWIPISVLAIIGPFRPGLTINKAKQRVLGSIAGLLISILIWFLIHYNYNLLVIIALLLVCGVAFAALQEYTYFIMLVTVML